MKHKQFVTAVNDDDDNDDDDIITYGNVTDIDINQYGMNDPEIIGDDEFITPGNISDIDIITNDDIIDTNNNCNNINPIIKTNFNVETIRRETNRKQEGYD
eukprot:35593_1